MKTKVLLFDFDGTIADTFAVAVGIFNEMSGEFGYRAVSPEELPYARKLGARQIMAEFGISTKMLPKVAARGLKLLREKIDQIDPYEGIPEVLRRMKSRGFLLGMLTSNSRENVSVFLRRHGLEVFDFVRCSSRLLGKSREIKAILKSGKWKSEDVVFLGDECRDIEAAHKAGIRVVGVTWGFNTPESLAALEPAALVHAPDEIPPLFSHADREA